MSDEAKDPTEPEAEPHEAAPEAPAEPVTEAAPVAEADAAASADEPAPWPEAGSAPAVEPAPPAFTPPPPPQPSSPPPSSAPPKLDGVGGAVSGAPAIPSDRPEVLIGGAFAGGFLAAMLLKRMGRR